MRIKHILSPGKCLNYLDINRQGDITCKECGRNIGFVYCVAPLRAFIHERYIRHKPKIIRYLRQILMDKDVLNSIDPQFLESNDATVRNVVDYLSSAFDENMVDVEEEAKQEECE